MHALADVHSFTNDIVRTSAKNCLKCSIGETDGNRYHWYVRKQKSQRGLRTSGSSKTLFFCPSTTLLGYFVLTPREEMHLRKQRVKNGMTRWPNVSAV